MRWGERKREKERERGREREIERKESYKEAEKLTHQNSFNLHSKTLNTQISTTLSDT